MSRGPGPWECWCGFVKTSPHTFHPEHCEEGLVEEPNPVVDEDEDAWPPEADGIYDD